jgi:phosphate transport system permease protein
MQTILLIGVLFILAVATYKIGRTKAIAMQQTQHLHSLPMYHGLYVALWTLLPALAVVAVWSALQPIIVANAVMGMLPSELLAPNGTPLPDNELALVLNTVRNVAVAGLNSTDADILSAADVYRAMASRGHTLLMVAALVLAVVCAVFAYRQLHVEKRTRNIVEGAVKVGMIICASIAILTTIGIIFSLLFESMLFFQKIPVLDFVFGLEWSPQTAIRADQVGASGTFGAIPLFVGTLLISAIALLVAVPIGLLSAIYMAEYAHARVRSVVKPVLEILAGVPTVVYGFFAALTVAPFLRDTGEQFLGLNISSESALAAGLVMGIMIIPFVSSLSDDVITAVPQALRQGSAGLGATQSETVRNVVLPAALPGIVGGVLLAASRAIGETMIVVMAAGLSSNLTANPLEAVTTVTVQIVTMLVGDQEFDSAKTLSAFALGLMLFVVTLALNIFALHVVRKYREQYE